MTYGKDLLRQAVQVAGTAYRLNQMTGLGESHLSEAINCKRQVPASWVLPLAEVAGIDPTEAMRKHRAERLAMRSPKP